MSSFRSQEGIRINSVKDFELYEITKGSLLEFKQDNYSHWAVYLGDGKICHLTQDPRDTRGSLAVLSSASSGVLQAVILEEDLEDIFEHEKLIKVYVNNSNDNKRRPFDPDVIVQRARSRKGKTTYSLTTYNCEHFANWCRYGEETSQQVKNVAIGFGAALGVAAVGGAIALFLRSSRDNKDKKSECKSKSTM